MRYKSRAQWLAFEWTPEEIAASCEEAAAVLEGHWIQGSWIVDTYAPKVRRYCVEGGMAAALGLHVQQKADHDRALLVTCPVYAAVLATAREQEDQPVRDLVHFNDYHSRTEQQVLDLLHDTAKRVLGVGPDQMEQKGSNQ